MRRPSAFPIPGFSSSACLIEGCTTAPLGSRPDIALDEDEQRLWKSVLEEERRFDQSGLLYSDPVITNYVNSVMARCSHRKLDNTACLSRSRY